MLLIILMVIFGIIALAKGEFKITNGRKVKGSTGRILGGVLLVGAAAGLIPNSGGGLAFLVLIVVVIVGLATAEKIEKLPPPVAAAAQPESPVDVNPQ
jgi:hypothetical protein